MENRIFKLSALSEKTSLQTRYNSMLAGNASYIPAFNSIQTTTVGAGGSSTITFSSIPQTYTHLQVRLFARLTSSVNVDDTNWTFNGDTGANYYATHQLRGNGSAVSGYASGANNYFRPCPPPGALTGSNIFSIGIIDILEYSTSGQKYKTIKSMSGYADNTGNFNASFWFRSSLWMNTNAVSSISIAANSGNLAQYTHAALYGVV